MISSYMGKPGAGMTLPRTPPVENSKAPGGPGVADGRGVCTLPYFSVGWGVDGVVGSVRCKTFEDVIACLVVAYAAGRTVFVVELVQS